MHPDVMLPLVCPARRLADSPAMFLLLLCCSCDCCLSHLFPAVLGSVQVGSQSRSVDEGWGYIVMLYHVLYCIVLYSE